VAATSRRAASPSSARRRPLRVRKRALGPGGDDVLSGLGAAVLDALPISLYVVDRQLKVVAWNRAREEGPLGRPRGEVLGHPLSQALPEGGFRATLPLLKQVFRTGEMHEDTKAAQEGRRLYLVRRLPLKQAGQVTHVLSWFEDVTEQRALEMRLIASDRLAFLGQLVAGVAHEVANPLASIAGCAEALASLAVQAQTGKARQEAEDFRNLIRDEIARCERIVRTMLGSARSHPQSTADVAHTVDTVMWLLARHPAFTRVRVVRRLAAPLPPAQIDADSLKQVVLALSMNAARAMRGGGTLTLEARRTGPREIHLDILDTGTGIAPAIRGRIFEPFFTTDATQGTGLGLAIARSLVHGRGGDLIYRPRRRGSAFRVVLKTAEEVS
jgi:two-component system, NtrC family, sensor kinase